MTCTFPRGQTPRSKAPRERERERKRPAEDDSPAPEESNRRSIQGLCETVLPKDGVLHVKT
jgi:hypothetical protein